MKTTVVNKSQVKPGLNDVYIGRPSKWGNPFRIGPDGSRQNVLDRYRAYLQTRSDLLASLEELRGKRLVCWCKPKPCHGDILIELLEEQERQQKLF